MASKYMTWQLIAPPATRFYQMVDGNFSMYFEREKIADMVEWSEKQTEAFRRLAEFIKQQVVEEENAAVAAAQKAGELSELAAGMNPKASAGFVPNIKTTEAKPKPPIKVMKGVKPPKMTVAGQPVTTQAEVLEAIPDLPPPKPRPDLTNDPGLNIALKQQKLLDATKGINREAKNTAPDEEVEAEGEEVEETEEEEENTEPDAGPPVEEEEEETPETERPQGDTAPTMQPPGVQTKPVDDDESPY